MKLLASLSFLAFAATVAPAVAQSDPAASDKALVQYLVSDSQAEIALSRLALQKSQSPAVKAFAQRMIADHTAAIAQAGLLAKAQNLGTLDQGPAQEGIVELNHLAKYNGHDFDENFMERNVDDHASDITIVRHASEVTQNPTVKAFENQQLAMLETHLLLSEQTWDRVAQTQQ